MILLLWPDAAAGSAGILTAAEREFGVINTDFEDTNMKIDKVKGIHTLIA